MATHSYLTCQSDFKGQNTVLLILEMDGVEWLIANFERSRSFTIGSTGPISLRNCGVFDIVISSREWDIREESIGFPLSCLCITPMQAELNAKYLMAMKELSSPCHQYLEASDASGNSVQFLASFGEYNANEFE